MLNILSVGQLIGIFIGVFFATLITFMLIRTVVVKPEKQIEIDANLPHVDKEKVANLLSKAVSYKTVTLIDDEGDGSVFLEFQKFLEKSFPLVMKGAEKVSINKYSAMYIYRGTNTDLLPIAVLAHQDVVPADEEGWDVPAFSGEIKDNYVYGRGSQDMKSQLIACLEGLEILLSKNIEIQRTIYFCFGHDEERKGIYGAKLIVDKFLEEGQRFELVIDEGGSIIDGNMLGINKHIALIGTCEKGYADLILEVNQESGHASTPPRKTAVGTLAKGIYKIEKKKMKTRWSQPVLDMFDALAPYMKAPLKFVAVNKDLLSFVLRPVLDLISPFTSCLVRTTFAPTQLLGSDTPNTLPASAKASINCRILPGETVDDVVKHVKKRAKGVEVTVVEGETNPSLISPSKGKQYEYISNSILEVFPDTIVAPYIFIATSDSKYYHQVSNYVYRFTPFLKEVDDANRIHGVNERQDIDMLVKGVEFFYKLYENACSNIENE